MPPAPYRLGFAVKVLGALEPLKEADKRRWQSGPHLRRSIDLLHAVWDHLERIDVRMYRMSSSVIPYGSHPDLPEFDYRRQIDECADALAELGARARAMGLRLSTHPGQYTVINGADDGLCGRSLAELEANAALLDAMGCGPEATVVVHVGGLYGDRSSALDRWATAWERLSEGARARIGLENDERLFTVADALELHRRTGVRVVYDHHHARINPVPGMQPAEALSAAMASWPGACVPRSICRAPGCRSRRFAARWPALGAAAMLPSRRRWGRMPTWSLRGTSSTSSWPQPRRSTSCWRLRPRTLR
ncbi:MAG: hypothetical protein LC798_07280 [Chloroflexi bacterium]|nr:hypothetical protein [Chloroflexota bacterium]